MLARLRHVLSSERGIGSIKSYPKVLLKGLLVQLHGGCLSLSLARATSVRRAWVFWDQEIILNLLPKNSSTSLTGYFKSLQTRGIRCEQVTDVSIRKLSLLASFQWFAIARNPRSRLMSAFNDKKGRSAYRNVPGLGSGTDAATFYNFIAKNPNLDPHWAPQATLVVLPKRTSWLRMDDDFDMVNCVAQLLGTPPVSPEETVRLNVTAVVVEASRESELALEDLLSTVYRADMELWESAPGCTGTPNA
jgi:hypothetical protein